MSQYAQFKLKDIQGFTVNKVFGFKWELWIEAERRYVREDKWFQGGKKKYNLGVTVNGEQGYLSVSANQYANMLEAYSREGKADIIGQSFTVKTNGKEGMDIRYYINPQYGRPDANDYSTTHDNTPTPSGYNEIQDIASQFGGTIVSQTPMPQQGGKNVSNGVVGSGENGEVLVSDIPF